MSDDAQSPTWTRQLAPLASQHHLSEYSRIKYGHNGCPVLYTPLSPDVVHTLRERQKTYADQVLWWPCATPADPAASPTIPAAKQRAALVAGETIPHPELHQELSSALSESISNAPLHVKTSASHPINISQIIPPESLVAISSHLTPCKRPCPVLFEIHFPSSLDHITGYPHLSLARVRSPVLSASIPPAPPVLPHHEYSQLRPSVTGVLTAALSTKISLPSLSVPSPKILLSLKRSLKIHTIPDRAPQIGVANATPDPRHSQPLQNQLALSTTYALHPFSAHARPPTAPSPPNKISKSRASKSSSTAPSRQTSRRSTTNQRPFKLGNLLLSSCPGKKVRLTGPARGRSAVCRDLDVDLRRMRLLGTRCVVCCLDDEELEFLIGISWTEYCQIAHREGLDVLRIPLPEGLTPLSPKSLDADLDRIIERYTLQGISVLVHCRGGVGRAGLFACCWMLKLGLCGWIETDASPTATSTTSTTNLGATHNDTPSRNFQWNSDIVVRRDTLQLVERVIEVVRRRRSVKAIETLEQVQFLVEYVDYLRTCGRASGSTNS